MGLIIGWITWARVGEEEKEEIRDMLAISFDPQDKTTHTKKAVRRELTDQYLDAGKGIRKLTLRKYRARPVWLKKSVWNELDGEAGDDSDGSN